MTKLSRRSARIIARGLTAAALSAAVAIFCNACLDDSARIIARAGETGRVELNLVGVSGTRQSYRLRDASFTITARTTGGAVTVSTEDDPDSSSLEVELAPDVYEVYLRPGYHLESVDAGLPITDAALVSTNPGLVAVASDTASTLDFVFRVGVGVGVGGSEASNSLLSVGLEVQEGASECLLDAFEPNSDSVTATPIEAGVQVSATLCGDDYMDFYTFDAPQVEGEGFSVRVGFDPTRGSLERGELFDADTGDSLGGFAPTRDGAVINTFSSASRFELQLIRTDASSFAYTIDIGERSDETGCAPDAYEPNAASETAAPISASVPVSANLCYVAEPGDSYFLDNDYYTFAAPTGTGLGFTLRMSAENFAQASVYSLPDHVTVGVLDVSREGAQVDIVSNAEAFELLVYGVNGPYSIDIGECAACKNDRAVSDCCTASDAPGCTEGAIHACTCAADISCCTSSFDEACVVTAAAECGAECPLPAPASDCCSASQAPGCTAPDVQACVCDIDPFCCKNGFDDNCAHIAQGLCGAACTPSQD